MHRSIPIIKECFRRLRYENVQFLPSRRSKFIGNELFVLRSAILRDEASVFNSSAFHFLYRHIFRIPNPKLYALYRAAFLCEYLREKEFIALFGADGIEILLEEGVLRKADGKYKFTLRFIPVESLLIAASPEADVDSAGYVHIGYDTLTLWRFLKRELEGVKATSALEIGSGTGFISLWMSTIASRITASDINPRAVEMTNLNAEINGINNVVTVESDVYSKIAGKYDIIVSNPPFEFLPPEEKNKIHSYGGRHGIDITLRILVGLEEHLGEDGSCYILANSYIKESGTDTLKNEIVKLFGTKPFKIEMFEATYQLRPEFSEFYRKNGISHSISYIISVKRSDNFSLITIPLRGFVRFKENVRLATLRLACEG
jgi:HemK-related putative methylase